MSLVLHYASGSPFAWRVWLALEHKAIPHEFRLLSFDAGDLETPAFGALNPRRKIPVIEHDGFVLYESAAILDYLDDAWPAAPHLLSRDLRQRATQRRMIREADAYAGLAMEHFFDALGEEGAPNEAKAAGALREEFARWESVTTGPWLAGELSAADFTLYPMVALILRVAGRRASLSGTPMAGPNLTAWAGRMADLPVVRKTWPPHWR